MRRSDRVRLRRRGGFTLLEVMAAVLVLGLLYTVLAQAALNGLRSEGINRRRAEASLLADQKLMVVEATLEFGEPLEPYTEEEVGTYKIVTRLEPVDVTQWLPVETEEADAEDLDTLLGTEEGEGRIQQATLTVEWDEAGTPYQVLRTTFLFDTAGLDALFPDTPTLPGLPAGGSNELGGDDQPTLLPDDFESRASPNREDES